MTLIEIFTILLNHWFADFILQTEEQANKKSTHFKFLIKHTSNYSYTWFPIMVGMFYYNKADIILAIVLAIIFCCITFILHTITDYITSRINKKLIPKRQYLVSHPHLSNYFTFINENWRKFFISLGFDQILHYGQLFMTYHYLKMLI